MSPYAVEYTPEGVRITHRRTRAWGLYTTKGVYLSGPLCFCYSRFWRITNASPTR